MDVTGVVHRYPNNHLDMQMRKELDKEDIRNNNKNDDIGK